MAQFSGVQFQCSGSSSFQYSDSYRLSLLHLSLSLHLKGHTSPNLVLIISTVSGSRVSSPD